MPQGNKKASTPLHIATFGTSRLFGGRVPLFKPEPEENADTPYGGLSRQQFINEEKARQLDKGVDYLANKNAELQADLNALRSRLPKDGQVVVSAADAALLDSYRELFPNPKEAKTARERLTALEEKEELRSYDDARREALAEFQELPVGFQKLIPTAEELLQRPGGKEQLGNLDFLKQQVEAIATTYGAERQNKEAQTDTGISPGEVKSSAQDASRTDDVRTLARDIVKSRYQQKEG